MNLAGGCVCCDTKEDLSWGIAQLVKDYRSELIVLECSGLADPVEVVDAVTDLYTARLAKLERIIALLHPISSEQSHSSVFVTEQAIRCADELILNKHDLYVPGHWEQFKASILAQNSDARLWETTHARIDPSVLLAPRLQEKISASTNVMFGKPRRFISFDLPSDRHNHSPARLVTPATLSLMDQDTAQRTGTGQRLFPFRQRARAAGIPICAAWTTYDHAGHVVG